jgi:hypothetical protein
MGISSNMILEGSKGGWNSFDLFNSGCQVSKGRKNPKQSGLRTLKNLVPYVGTKSVLFQFLHVGVTLPHMNYQVDLMFSDVEFSKEDMSSDFNNWVCIVYKGNKVFMKKLDLKTNRVKVRCACPDFYFTFAYWNFNKGALFGSKPKRYVRKTIWNPSAPPGHRGYPPRNPGEYPGMCKHVANSIELAQQNNWIKGTPRLF